MLRKGIKYLIVAFALTLLSFSFGYSTIMPLQSTYTGTPPSVDGSYTPGEWPSTAAIEIADPIHTKVYISNNYNNLYMFVDAADAALGDYTEENQDHCSVYVYKNGKGLQVMVDGSGTTSCTSTSSASSPLSWGGITCPWGVEAKAGFGQGPDTAPDHRMYEFKIPLSTIGAYPGDIIYFASPYDTIDSLPFDYNGNSPTRSNTWPLNSTPDDLNTWGQIQLGGSVSVPSLNEWGVMIFVVIAGIGAVYYIRRHIRVES
jgi:hypothetical protein